MQFVKELLPIFKIYQICGIFPISLIVSSGSNRLQLANARKWYFYSALVTVFFSYFVVKNFMDFNTGPETSKMMNYLEFVSR